MNRMHINKYAKAIAKILDLYSVALRDGQIKKPLAWAIHEVWLMVDEKGD